MPQQEYGTNFAVKTDAFEGPLGLLLRLIEKRKVHINDIALASVTEEYVATVQTEEHFPIDDASHFILIASTLLAIKSRSLLPGFALVEKEEHDIAELEGRLKNLQFVRALGTTLAECYGTRRMYRPRIQRKRTQTHAFNPGTALTTEALYAPVENICARITALHTRTATVAVKISMEEATHNVLERARASVATLFSSTAPESSERSDVIIHFLALLELIKQGSVVARQHKPYDDIILESDTVHVPMYG